MGKIRNKLEKVWEKGRTYDGGLFSSSKLHTCNEALQAILTEIKKGNNESP